VVSRNAEARKGSSNSPGRLKVIVLKVPNVLYVVYN
jgi:hypothetical protein